LILPAFLTQLLSLHHRLPFDEGLAHNADLTGPSPVEQRNGNNQLEGYNYYHLDTGSQVAVDTREFRNGVEQFWQVRSNAGQIVGAGMTTSGEAVGSVLEAGIPGR
jgi:hypothetical protein